ncbi:MAG: MarR family EPS-associated transcriptional regulator [Desulfurivibrio sp.]|nr:MarR family EPS-associated transcriptional regulator [Desulfurivibrio sp.]
MDDSTRYHLLKLLHQQPELSQRQLARRLGISLGKTNYCLQALIKVGAVKARNFRTSQNKAAYLYKLTPAGLEEKTQVTNNQTLPPAQIDRIRRTPAADRRTASRRGGGKKPLTRPPAGLKSTTWKPHPMDNPTLNSLINRFATKQATIGIVGLGWKK